MKKRWIKASSTLLIGILFVVLLITCPDEEDYAEWLTNKHLVTCTDNLELHVRECKKGGKKIIRESGHVQSAGIYMKVEEIYTSGNKTFNFRAFGILGHFWDYSEIIIKDKPHL